MARPHLAALASAPGDRAAGDGRPLAPHRLAALLNLEERRRTPGRPSIDGELAALIRQMSGENPRWGHMRVRGELRELGSRAGLQTVRRYRKRLRRDPGPSTGWSTFLRNQRPELWAADCFTVQAVRSRE